MVTSYEQVPVQIFTTPKEGSSYVALQVAAIIRARQMEGKKCVLGMATGSTPISMYKELVRLHKEEGLSFKTVSYTHLTLPTILRV